MATALFAILLLVIESSVSQDFISYTEGDSSLPLIISAPHGGYETPDEYPTRHDGCLVNGNCVYEQNCTPQDPDNCGVSTSRDSFTQEIALDVSQYILSETGLQPYVVINELHRSKLDANREINEATLGNDITITQFNLYHQRIQEAITSINGRALFLDFHGQTHSEEWTELGYTLSRTNLNNQELPESTCSITRLMEESCPPNDIICSYQFINGESSFGHILSEKSAEYLVVPSPNVPSPGTGNYFSGGYLTVTYGSSSVGSTDAIQIEMPRKIRFSEEGFDRTIFAQDLAMTILEFLEANEYTSFTRTETIWGVYSPGCIVWNSADFPEEETTTTISLVSSIDISE